MAKRTSTPPEKPTPAKSTERAGTGRASAPRRLGLATPRKKGTSKAGSASASVRKLPEEAYTSLNLSRVLLWGLIGGMVLAGLVFIVQPGFLGWMGDHGAPINSLTSNNTRTGITDANADVADFFSPQVLYWEEEIERWGQERNLNPNLIATIMQIESCGHPYISSNAGAQGLMQVMPFHFADGENQIDPEINAYRGLNHLVDCLGWSNYDVGVAFACYNGGPSVINIPQSQWYQETRNYYRWGGGIWDEASRGLEESATLTEWLNAGGVNLCQQAAQTQALFQP